MSEIEERARQMGWTEREDFRGNPDNWVDAETFVSRADTSLPIAKGTIKRLEGELAGVKQTLAEFSEFYKGAEKRAYDRALKDLQAREIEAVEEGDTDKFKKVRDEYNNLIKDHPMAGGQGKPASGPVDNQTIIQEWIAQNEWYSENEEMFEYANKMDKFLGMKNQGKDPREHMASVLEAVKKKFPDYFGNGSAKRSAPSMVDSGGDAAPPNSGKRGYSNLPQWAKEQCDRFVKDKVLTREQYCKDFQWE